MKKLLLSLFVGCIGIINFGFCDDMLLQNVYSEDFYGYIFDTYVTNNNVDILCLKNVDCPNGSLTFSANHTSTGYGTEVGNIGGLGYCTMDGTLYYSIENGSCHITINGYNVKQMSSLECQTEYNLIPVGDVDINYCVGNGLCPNECGSGTDLSGDLQYSNIYINSILHPGEENIFIDIPDYIQWDYSIATGEFNIYVGSGYDMDYMNSIIKINSYRPTSSDFTNIFVSGLTLIFPYIFVLLLIIFMWKLIKRVFK